MNQQVLSVAQVIGLLPFEEVKREAQTLLMKKGYRQLNRFSLPLSL